MELTDKKCDTCSHEKVCGRKGEYKGALKKIEEALAEESIVDISVGCKHHNVTPTTFIKNAKTMFDIKRKGEATE